MTYTFNKSRGKFSLTSSIEPGFKWETTSRSEVESFIPTVLQVSEFHWKEVDAFMKEVISIVRPRGKSVSNKCSITRK